MQLDIIFSVIILIMSVVVHEVSHGLAANYLGDPTARLSGRLSLNPLKHLDPFGSIIVPLLLFVSRAGFLFGWARPVPVNLYNLRGRYGETIVAAAGPLSNILLALVFGLLLRFGGTFLPQAFSDIAASVVLINIVLAVFNSVPIPPLDGSKVLFAFMPLSAQAVRDALERYSFFIILIFVIFLWQFITPIIGFLFSLVTGLKL